MTSLLMTADAVGGVWTYALELASALARYGFHTTLAVMGPAPRPDQLETLQDVAGLSIVTREYRLEWMDDPWADVAAAGDWLLGLEAALSPAIVHLNGYAHGSLAWRAPVVVVGHSCLLSWDEAVPGALDRETLAAYRAAVRNGVRAADWIAAPSAAMLAAIQRHYGPCRNASVVPNGRTAARFGPARKKPLVFAAGRLWDRAKNIGALAAIAPHLPWPVAVAGADGSDALEKPAAVQRLGMLSADALAGWLGRASIFVSPARYEPFGLLPLEAALSGCALVLGDIPSLREVWDDAAVYIDPSDSEALLDAIRQLIAAPRTLDALAAAARERALTYTPERMAAGYAAIYGAVLGRTREWRRLPCAS